MGRRRVTWVWVLLLLACSDLDNVDVPVEGQTTVPGGSIVDQVLGDLDFAGFNSFDLTDSQQFENEGYTEDQIDSVILTELILEVSSPADADFDFLSSVEFFIQAEGLERVRIASDTAIADGVRRLELALDPVELSPYVVAETVEIVTEASGVAPEQDTVVDARAVFDVDIDVSGAAGCAAAGRAAHRQIAISAAR